MWLATQYKTKPGPAARLNRSHSLAKGLVGCWLMNGSGIRVYDASGHGHTCSAYGNVARCAGRFGSALELGGDSDYLGRDVSPVFDTTADDTRTISAWIYPRELPGYPYSYIASQGQTGTFDYHIRLSSGYLQAGNTDGASTCHPDALSTNQWQHIAVVFSSAGAIGYVNGTAGTLVDRKTKASLSDDKFEIGRLVTGTGYFNGLIDHVMIYSRALSAGEVRLLYSAPFNMFCRRSRPQLVPRPRNYVNWWAGGLPEIERQWLRETLLNATTSNAFGLGTSMTGGWFWMRTSGCLALFRGPDMSRIDFANMLNVCDSDAETISVPDYVGHQIGKRYCYVARRLNKCGYSERTLRGVAILSFNEQGQLAPNKPNGIYGAKVKPADGGAVKLSWSYCPLGQKSPPVLFNIYCDSGSGEIDYDNPCATVRYRGPGAYSHRSGQLEAGRHLFAIRADDANGSEADSCPELPIDVDLDAPSGAGVLHTESL